MNTNGLQKNKVESMTSRQRVMNAVSHKPVDRTPIDLGMHYSTGISAFAYRDLRRHLGFDDHNVWIPDLWQFLAYVEPDILERFHCDCILLHPGYKQEQIWNPREDYRFRVPKGITYTQQNDGMWIAKSQSGEGCMRMPDRGYFFDGQGFSLDVYTEAEYKTKLKYEAERIYHETEYYTVYIGFGGYFSDNPDYLCDIMLEPEKIKEQNQKYLENEIKRAGELIDLLGEHIQGVCIASDLGTQTAPFCRPSIYEEVSAPYIKQFCEFIHKNSDWKVFFHSCGSIEPMIPIIIDCGVDILNPVQVGAKNMDPVQLKAKYGDKICFWGGGCDTQNVLWKGTPDEVRGNVRELMKAFKAPIPDKLSYNTGFVFNQVHNVMGNVPPENIVAMLDEAYENAW